VAGGRYQRHPFWCAELQGSGRGGYDPVSSSSQTQRSGLRRAASAATVGVGGLGQSWIFASSCICRSPS